MIQRFQKGNPFQTDSVVQSLPVSGGEMPYFTWEGTTVRTRLEEKDKVYGLGENMRGINKRGGRYESNNTDDPNHTENKVSLYGSHNFFVIDGSRTAGLFLDYPGKISYDIGFTRSSELVIRMEEADADLYVITPDEDGKSALNSVIVQFRCLIGRSYIPPRWAFGYGQSRWSYPDEASVREVVRGCRENGMPLDAVYLDIDYMDGYRDFTVSREAFPDLEGFSKELQAQGIHLVPIIDAGIKSDENYDTDREGLEKGYFCTMEDGTPFEGAVWPGLAHFPDVLNSEAREWFGMKYKVLTDMGIDGFWNDMNEPALFYTRAGLKHLWKKAEEYSGKENLALNELWDFTGTVDSVKNAKADYESFYHNADGKRIRHDKVHNLYGYNMTRAAAEAFEKLRPGKRTLLFSRSSCIGMHRYGGIWTGDNQAWWAHLLLNVKMMPSLNMCGFLYIGADLGGFGGDTTEDLTMRWLEFGLFTPLMRNHAALGTRYKECYQFERKKDFANILGIRYGLLPYLYSEYMKAALGDGMYFSTLAMVYPEDEFAPQTEDQLFVGESIMVAPVCEQNAEGRYVYLPERMKMMRLRSMKDYDEEILEAGHHYVKAALNEVLIFIRPDHLVPVSSGGSNTEEVDYDMVKLWGYPVKEAVYEYYTDDGISMDYENPKNRRTLTIKA